MFFFLFENYTQIRIALIYLNFLTYYRSIQHKQVQLEYELIVLNFV